jgi:hypothetical protein
MTAMDDLTAYQAFDQAHVDGLKNLTLAFTSLNEWVPDEHRKDADQVFENFGKDKAPTHSQPGSARFPRDEASLITGGQR